MREDLRIFKALSDETRLNILYMLYNGERCVCEIVKNIDRSQSTVSFQLTKLEDMGIVESRRFGRNVYYRLANSRVKKILKLMLEVDDV